MKSLNIAMLHYSAPPVVGGVEQVMQEHARLFAQDGHAVTIIAGKGALDMDGVELVKHPSLDSSSPEILAVKKKLDQGLIPSSFLKIKDELLEFLREKAADVDVLIAHNICSLHKNLPLTAALNEFVQEASSPPLIAWHHDLAWTNDQYRKELKNDWPWDLLKRPWHKRKQAHVAVSAMRQAEISHLFGIPKSKITVIPSGMDWVRFLKLGEKTAKIIRRFNLLDAEPLFLLPARITRRKNIELAIRLIALMEKEFPAATLLVTGPPGPHNPNNRSYFDELLALRTELGLGDGSQGMAGKPRVIFLAEHSEDFLLDDVIADLFRFSDALLFPSSQEGFGIPILEAGLTGMPIFCSDIPPFRETAGQRAVFFDYQAQPEQIAEKIIKEIKKDARIALKGHVKQNFAWENVFDRKIMPLIRSVL
jgi:glycosyltransferase involved in cell wall biosynthesis